MAALAGRYAIERELGAGGMATVYLAHDVRHDRKVALKVLRPELASILGAERFLSEIRTTANLQHPHILSLFDSGEADGLVFYVMPYVEGESLRDRLTRERQLPVEEAIRIASEVAGALDYAHRHGVVHRDIKPENILLHEGQALVADFGIALAASRTGGGTRLTETGMSLGTPHYMAPEQAMGEKEITLRADLYALGCVLYEMLAGEPPFTGPSAQAIVARVMTEQPRSLTLQRHTVPPHVEAAVLKGLEKLPADRFATAAEFVAALKDARYGAVAARAASASVAPAATPWWRDWRPWAVAAALAVAGVALGRLLRGPKSPPASVERFEITVPAAQGFTGAPLNALALSPDGGLLVYVGRASAGSGFQLYARHLGQLEPFHAIPGSESGAFPAFSPDGSQLAYMTPDGPRVVPVPFAGAAAASVSAPVQWLGGLVWLGNAALVMTDTGGALVRVGLDGRVAILAKPNAVSERNLFPQATLPDGRTVLTIAARGNTTFGPVVAVDATSGRRAAVLGTGVTGAWYAQRNLLWCLPSGVLQAAPFDPGRLRITGAAVTLAEGVRQVVGGSGLVAVSEAGSLVYLPEQPFSLVLVDAAGRREVVAQGRRFHSPRFSPDGTRLLTDFLQQGSRDVWSVDLRQRTLSRMTFENDGHDPVWSPDGRWVYYVHDAGIWRRRADGGGTADSVFTGNDAQVLGFARDGAILGASGSGPFDLVLLSATTPRTVTPLVATPFDEEAGALSPDGRWLAYVSDETGRPEIYVRPFAGSGGKVLVSEGGGAEPRWSPDGRTLYYRGVKDAAQYLVAARVAAGAEFSVSGRTPLFDVTDFDTAEPHANWDVSPDGKRFAMVDVGAMTDMVFVVNWPLEVARGQNRRAP